MTRRKALTIALSVVAVSGLISVLMLLSSKPETVEAKASYAWKPGCHCGAPTTTTAKPTTTTTKKVTTTTKKVTTTTAKATTTTTTKASTTTATSTVKSTPTQSTAAKASATTASSGKTKKSATTTSTEEDDADDTDADDALAIGASVDSHPGGGDGSSGDGGSGISGGEPVASGTFGPPHYYFSPVAIGFLGVYGVSFGLYRTRRMKVTTHRKIWNMLLLGTFMLCGAIGLLLAVGITRSTPWALPGWLLVWHVETGIAMCFISFFHIGWHARYYLAIVTGKHRAARPERALAPEGAKASEQGAARERVSRPRQTRPGTVRTAEERVLAFQQRQAARGGRPAQPEGSHTEAERWLEERRRIAPAS
jgi:hypothetical protein